MSLSRRSFEPPGHPDPGYGASHGGPSFGVGSGEGKEKTVRARILIAVGVLLAAAGVLWTLQGLGVVGGSVMSGNTTWAVIGPIVVIVALALVFIGVRGLRGSSKASGE